MNIWLDNMDKIKTIITQIEELKQDKKFDEAIKILEKNLSNHVDDYRLHEELADIYLYEWNFIKSKKSIDFALSLNKESPTWNYLKGFILLSNNKVKESISYLEKSNKLMWNNSEVLRNLWWAYTIVWNAEKWVLILKRALNLSPGDKLITEDLAMALIWLWEVKKGNVLLEKIGKKKS